MGRPDVSERELVGMRDNIDLYMEHELDQERQYQKWLETRPVCEYCGDPIEDDEAMYIDGDYYHIECAEVRFVRNI